jgi:hypothetical protein
VFSLTVGLPQIPRDSGMMKGVCNEAQAEYTREIMHAMRENTKMNVLGLRQ